MPLVIGITGAIASGKSTACQILENLGGTHCDADKLVHRMYDPGKPAFHRIVKSFGNEVVGPDGFIDRKQLGSKVFGNPEKMSALTIAIGDIKAEVSGVMKEWRNTLGFLKVGLMEAVNFIEAGYGIYSDLTWLFAVNDSVAIKRLKSRNNFSEEEATQRLSSQKRWQDRVPASDIVTMNNGSLEELKGSVTKQYNELIDRYSKGLLPPSKYINWWQKHSP
ncbi:MAG: dephospho-CoA kinase [Chloroflexi bacterium]|jgi:dephospho-CoA kinase|nr:MAG: dephospho-CoA kinase [Chloroflexota bacterium]